MEKNKVLYLLELVKAGLLSNDHSDNQMNSFIFMNGRLFTYNDRICINVDAAGIPITGAVLASELVTFLNRVKNDTIDISQDEKEILLVAGRARVGLVYTKEIQLEGEFKRIIKRQKKGTWFELPIDFMSTLKDVANVCSTDQSQPKFTCVYMNGTKGFIAGTDRYRLLKINTPVLQSAFGRDILLPADIISLLSSFEFTHFLLDDGWLHFKTSNGAFVSCRLAEETTFVDIDKAIKAATSTNVIEFPETIKEILQRAEVFLDKADMSHGKVAVIVGNKRFTVKASNPTGWFEEDVRVRYAGDVVEFFINPISLTSIIDTVRTAQITPNFIKFEFEDGVYISALLV